MLIRRQQVRTRQPQVPVIIDPKWIKRGLYTVSVPGLGDLLSGGYAPVDAATTIAVSSLGKLFSQATAGTPSAGINFPKRVLSARTDLFVQLCTDRRYYGAWVTSGGADRWLGEYADAELRWIIHGTDWATSAEVFSGASPVSLVGKPRTICGIWNKDKNAGFGRAFVDDVEVARSGGTALTGVCNRTHSTAKNIIGPGQNMSGLALFLGFDQDLTVDEVKLLSDNPWQIFTPEVTSLFFGTGAAVGADLAGNAQAQVTATANLTLHASLDGAALSVATASGNLSTSIPLAGSAVAIGSANGSLTSGIKLSAAAVASALSSGSLVAQIKLNGAALAQVAASVGLTSAILLAGTMQGQATASGTLAANPGSLSANAQAQATAVATLTTGIKLSGSAAVQAGVSGILTTRISLTAAALAQAIATGMLAVPILLAGAAHGVATATGNLTAPDSPASTVYFRVNSAVERLARVASAADRLTQASSTAQRLTSITHEVQHV